MHATFRDITAHKAGSLRGKLWPKFSSEPGKTQHSEVQLRFWRWQQPLLNSPRQPTLSCHKTFRCLQSPLACNWCWVEPTWAMGGLGKLQLSMSSSFLLLPDNSLGDLSSEVVGGSEWTQLIYTCSSFYDFQVISQVTRLNISASWAYGGQLLTCASSRIFFTCLMASVTSWLGGSTRELLAPKEKPPYLKVQIDRKWC